jgi:hypothetical protein
MLQGHQVDTISGRGWVGLKNGPLLQHMRGGYDVLATMDRNLEFQQNIAALPFGILLIRAASNRMAHLAPLVPEILEALPHVMPGQLHRVGT